MHIRKLKPSSLTFIGTVRSIELFIYCYVYQNRDTKNSRPQWYEGFKKDYIVFLKWWPNVSGWGRHTQTLAVHTSVTCPLPDGEDRLRSQK